MYERDSGENGCYYFHTSPDSYAYNYKKSKEFCNGIQGANGSLPIIKGPKDDSNMLQLLRGYVSRIISTIKRTDLLPLIYMSPYYS